jgi:hypothetical protein
MNQIAVKANAKGFVDTASYWENVRWLKETVIKLMEVMYRNGNHIYLESQRVYQQGPALRAEPDKTTSRK